jgi:excinuclease ABC subunit A
VQDRLRCAPANRARFTEACEQAYHFGKGRLTVWEIHPPSAILHPRRFSAALHCARCDLDYRDPSPALFSFNHPVGACPACKGFGRIVGIDYDLALPDRSLTLADGAVKPWRGGFSAECQGDMRKFCKLRGVPMNVPFRDLATWQQDWVTFGDKDYGIDEDHQWPRAWYGIKGYFKWLESKAYKMHVRVLLSRYRAYTKCPDCEGARFQRDALLYLLRVGQASRLSPASSDKKSETGATPVLLSLADFYALSVDRALAVVEAVAAGSLFAGQGRSTISIVLQEAISRLRYLREVGLGYLTLDRPTRTLSGGETERVNLTTCLGTRLVNTLYVLDEPSVGLHPRDTARLVSILEKLRDTGNTVVVVEHEPSVMRAADQIVDLGPGHGESGGQVVFQGTVRELLKCEASLTGRYLSGRQRVEVRERRPVRAENPKSEIRNPKEIRSPKSEKVPAGGSVRISDFGLPSDFGLRTSDFPHLSLHHATCHNLKDLSVSIPLNRFVCLTGVSGSGKTTLVRDVLLPALQEKLNAPAETAKASDRADIESDERTDDESAIRNPQSVSISGVEHLSRVLMVDQTSLGKTPRSNPAVYVGAFDHIREVFAQTETAHQRGLNASSFSFNSAQGQCERCRGAGFEKIEMQFLSDIFIRCPDCAGRRYRGHILDVKIEAPGGEVRSPKSEVRSKAGRARKAARAWSIADVLDATVDEAGDFLAGFADSKPAARARAALQLLQDVGLGYLRLGQPINTLSGGESQRLKLAAHLAEAADRMTGVAPVSDPPDGNRRDACPTLFIFDEPTTGLHFEDVRVLLLVFQRLVDAGHSVLVIEHNLDVIKCADWVIDLGPEAGEGGGRLVSAGTPETIAACAESHTGRFLREVLVK